MEMKERHVLQKIQGTRTVDGAGVHLVRVLDNRTVGPFDPFLMLDSFLTVKIPTNTPPVFPCIPIGASKPSPIL